jgi:DNA-binding beta-propeller fold protein YncE
MSRAINRRRLTAQWAVFLLPLVIFACGASFASPQFDDFGDYTPPEEDPNAPPVPGYDPEIDDILPDGYVIYDEDETDDDFVQEDALPYCYATSDGSLNSVVDLAIIEGGFLAGTPHGIIRYRYVGDIPEFAAKYTTADGLPGDACSQLEVDALGGVWAICDSQVSHLAPNAEQWTPLEKQLADEAGLVARIVLSSDKNATWLACSEGVIHLSVDAAEGRFYPMKNIANIVPHPGNPAIVWCEQQSLLSCGCVHSSLLELNTETGEFKPLGNDEHEHGLSASQIVYDPERDALWLSGPCEPPILHNYQSGNSTVFPSEPNWETIEDGNTVRYSDYFGQMLPHHPARDGAWFATQAGLWQYATDPDEWIGHKHFDPRGASSPMVTQSLDGKTIYWADEGNVATFDVTTGVWLPLWKMGGGGGYISYSGDEGIDTSTFWPAPKNGLTLAPDGKHLWMLEVGFVCVGDLTTGDGNVLNLSTPGRAQYAGVHFYEFDETHEVVLLATTRGVIGTDYSGRLLWQSHHPGQSLNETIEYLLPSPDGRELWCAEPNTSLYYDEHVPFLRISEDRWFFAPKVEDAGRLRGIAFAEDGSRGWVMISQKGGAKLYERTAGEGAWRLIPLRSGEEIGCNGICPSPDNKELSIVLALGIVRVNLEDGSDIWYEDESFDLYRSGTRRYTLVNSFVGDLVYTRDGRFLVVAANGGGEAGLSVIDRKTGEPTHVKVERAEFSKLILASDDRTVWCLSGPEAWAFDIPTCTWVRRLRREHTHLGGSPNALVSPDGDYVWLTEDGLECYSFEERTSTLFGGSKWYVWNRDGRQLYMTNDGNSVVTLHSDGVAVLDMNGENHTIISPEGAEITNVFFLKPIPHCDDFLCVAAVSDEDGSAMIAYRLDTAQRELHAVRRLGSMRPSSLAVGPDRYAWVGTTGGLLCFNVDTGEDRGLQSLQSEQPTVRAWNWESLDIGLPSVTPAPDHVEQAGVVEAANPNAEPEKRPTPENLDNAGMIWNSTHTPVIAFSESGNRLVTWFAHPDEDAEPNAGVPLIPESLLTFSLDDDQRYTPSQRAVLNSMPPDCTGLAVHDGEEWSDPQLLTNVPKSCDVEFAWYEGDELHALFSPRGAYVLRHLALDADLEAWRLIADLDHRECEVIQSGDLVHIVWIDHNTHRYGHRFWDGTAWSESTDIATFERYNGLDAMAQDNGTCHVVWRDGEEDVVYARVKDGEAIVSRAQFSERPIRGRDFTIATSNTEEVILYYSADIYEDHPDAEKPHRRVWKDGTWSKPERIVFGTREFGKPIALSYGSKHVLSWVDRPTDGVTRVFSVCNETGQWSAPVSLCDHQSLGIRCDYFVTLAIDPSGKLHAAWNAAGAGAEEQTWTVIVDDLFESE